jgi:hypothetical protein
MAGFLLRSLLQSFGSRLRDARPIENPEIEYGAARINRNEGITAAASLLLPRVVLIAEWVAATSSFRILHQEEAWNADHQQAHPVLTRSTDGAYVYTFAATYLDSDGVAVPTDLVSARCTAMQTANSGGASPVLKAGCEISVSAGPLAVQFFTYDSVGTSLEDHRFWLEVF